MLVPPVFMARTGFFYVSFPYFENIAVFLLTQTHCEDIAHSTSSAALRDVLCGINVLDWWELWLIRVLSTNPAWLTWPRQSGLVS